MITFPPIPERWNQKCHGHINEWIEKKWDLKWKEMRDGQAEQRHPPPFELIITENKSFLTFLQLEMTSGSKLVIRFSWRKTSNGSTVFQSFGRFVSCALFASMTTESGSDRLGLINSCPGAELRFPMRERFSKSFRTQVFQVLSDGSVRKAKEKMDGWSWTARIRESEEARIQTLDPLRVAFLCIDLKVLDSRQGMKSVGAVHEAELAWNKEENVRRCLIQRWMVLLCLRYMWIAVVARMQRKRMWWTNQK